MNRVVAVPAPDVRCAES